MDQLMQFLISASNLLLVVLGFSLIIFFHEMGHFLAARWAGIRVLAFAIGFGPAMCSYRKGLGWRRGSSEVEYKSLLAAQAAGAMTAEGNRSTPSTGISPTEYRLNALPFGGYVKMLGQDDADPSARSDEPDGYQQCKVWKRMIVISAGVVMNLLIAAILFVVVFMIGLKVEPAKIGYVNPTSPAGTAVATNAADLKVTTPGLQSGDLVTRVNGKRAANFNDLMIASAMARPGRKMTLEVERAGVPQPLLFEIEPREDSTSRMLQLGIGPASSAALIDLKKPEENTKFQKRLAESGLVGVLPGSRLVQVGSDTDIGSAYELVTAAEKSGGNSIPVVFEEVTKDHSPGKRWPAQIQPVRAMQIAYFRTEPSKPVAPSPHVLGLMPVMRVGEVNDNGKKTGLKDGDVFAQIGNVEWPSLPEGIAEIRGTKSGTIRVVVLRSDENGIEREVTLDAVKVNDGTIGFMADDTAKLSTRVAAWPSNLAANPESTSTKKNEAGDTSARIPDPPSVSLKLLRGTRITAVAGKPVKDFNELTIALTEATRASQSAESPTADVELTVLLPLAGNSPATSTVRWNIPASDVRSLQSLGWESPISPEWFERETFVQKASNPFEAVSQGLAQTRTVMLSTYVTFVRLFQGSVKVEHLKGPVGIAHVGTIVASKGLVWLMFFMALISVNLAVVNFLPLPIVDGGHFLFLLYEQITGKPVSLAVQNITALAGLALVIGMFLLVTFNDISNLIR